MIILQTSAENGVLSALADAIDDLTYKKQRDHRLLILSCYIDFDAVRELVERVSKHVRLVKVKLMFEFLEAFRSRRPNETLTKLKELKVWCKKKNVQFFWYPVRTGALMHAKGYALIQERGPNNRRSVVCIGSSNATLPGLGLSKRSPVNFELISISTTDDDLTEFVSCWNDLLKFRKSLSDAARREDTYEFSYALLSSGIFLHDWRDSIAAQVGLKYTLTTKGKAQVALNPELRKMGFKADRATISINPFIAVQFPPGHMLHRDFNKNYTIDTLLGRWCPRSVWEVVEHTIEQEDEFKKFLKAFKMATSESNLSKVAEIEQARSKTLTESGFVTHDLERVARWKEKVEMLRANKNKLARIFMRLEPFDLPYDYLARREVEALKDNLFQTMAVRSRQFLAARKVTEAEEQGDLLALQLTEDERSKLQTILLS